MRNVEEACVGAMVGAAFVFILQFWILLTIPACSILWWMGGAEGWSKNWRRIGVPSVLGIVFLVQTGNWYVVPSAFFMWSVLTIGYGIPDQGDDGSPLGRWVCKTFNLFPWLNREDAIKADIIVRGIIGFLMGLCWISLSFDYTLGWIVGLITLTVMFPLIVVVVE